MPNIVREALVVGIERYKHLGTVKGAASLATQIANLLEEKGGFNVTRLPVPEERTGKEIPSTGIVTEKQLGKAIQDLFNPQGSPHIPYTALFFFLGHGSRKEEKPNEFMGYLVTNNANSNGANAKEKKAGLLSFQWLCQQLYEGDVKQQVVFLDSCYSGEFLKFFEAQNEFETDNVKRDRCFITSTLAHKKASADALLTQALLETLDYIKQDKRKVTSKTLFDKLSDPRNGQRFYFLEKEKRGNPIFLTGQKTPSDSQISQYLKEDLNQQITVKELLQTSPDSQTDQYPKEDLNQQTNVKELFREKEKKEKIVDLLGILTFLSKQKEVPCSIILSQFGISARVLNELSKAELLTLSSIPKNPNCTVSLTQPGRNYIFNHS